MKHRFIDIFNHEGDKELLKYRLIKLQNTADLFIICDISDSLDVESFIMNNMNSFKDKILVLKNFNFKTNLDSIPQILSEINLDFEDIISFSDSTSIPYFEDPNFYKIFYFGPYILKSKVVDINDINVSETRELGSFLMFYHTLLKSKSDLPKMFDHIKKGEINLSLFLHIESGLKISNQIQIQPPTKSNFIFDFS